MSTKNIAVKEAQMSILDIQIVFSKYVLAQDTPTNNVMRRVLFGSHNNTDWNMAWKEATVEMPELLNHELVLRILGEEQA